MQTRKILAWDKTFFIEGMKLLSVISIVAFLGAGSWWLVRSFVESDLHDRLQSESQRIESSIHERFDTYVNTLVHVRSSLLVYGIPDREQFRKTTSLLELVNRYPGIQGIGIAPFVRREDVNEYTVKTRKQIPGFSMKPIADQEIYAPVQMIEPAGWMNQASVGFDMLSEKVRRQAIEEAVATGKPVLTLPINLNITENVRHFAGMILYLPFFKSVETPQTREERNQLAHGLIFGLFNQKGFFEGAFGSPSMRNEVVNFKLEALNEDKTFSSFYERFDMPPSEGRILSNARIIEVYGQKWKLTTTTLPHFFTQEDKYAPMVVAVVSFLIVLLIIVIFTTTVKQLRAEKVKTEAVNERQAISREQIRKLRKLNELSRKVSDAPDLHQLIEIYFITILDLDGTTHGFLYFNDDSYSDKKITLHSSRGFNQEYFDKKSLDQMEQQFLLNNKTFIRRSSQDADKILSFFLQPKGIPHFSDWLIFSVPSRDEGSTGLLFLGRTDGKVFTESDIEFIESFTSQTGISIDNLNLYRRAQDSSQSKSSFLANMSHEIRTPLNAIIGFSEILFRNETSENQRSNLIENIKKNGLQLTRIIDDILDISKVEAGRLVVESKKVSLSNLLNEVKSVMALRSKQKGIDFKVKSVGKVPSFIETDEIRLKQILMNLVGNAIKFTEQGSVQLNVEFQKTDNRQNIMNFYVVDTGIGLSPDQAKNLFLPFSQADNTSTRRFGGTGLGLSISKKLAQQLGGDIEILNSELGKGSTFKAFVTAGELLQADWKEFNPDDEHFDEGGKSGSNAKTLDNKDLILKKRKVLVVEDSEDNQGIFEFFLKHAGADVEIVDNGIDAVKCAESENYDIILMDIQIPLIDGKEATRRIRAHGFKKPIVALTAHAMPEERESCYEAGCNGQITKPISGEDFILRVSHYLEGANDI